MTEAESHPQPKTASPELLRLTFPYVLSALLAKRKQLFFLVIVSIGLGIVPTLKSELESALITQGDQHIGNYGSHPKVTLATVWNEPLARFQETSSTKDVGLPERLAKLVFARAHLSSAIGIYLLIGFFGLALQIGNARITSGLGKEIFGRLRSLGFRRGLEADICDLTSIPNGPGQYTAAIQQGATNSRDTYEYLLQATEQSHHLLVCEIVRPRS